MGKVTETSVTLKLSDNYNITSAITQEEINQVKKAATAIAKANKLFSECVKKIHSKEYKKEGELFACYNLRTIKNKKFTDSFVTIFSWKNKNLIEIDTDNGSDYWAKDPSGYAIFTTKNDNFNYNENLQNATLIIHKAPFSNQKIYFFKGKCSRMWISPIKFFNNSKSVVFELSTNCPYIWINGTRYSTGFVKTDTIEYIQKMFRLDLDSNWFATGLTKIR